MLAMFLRLSGLSVLLVLASSAALGSRHDQVASHPIAACGRSQWLQSGPTRRPEGPQAAVMPELGSNLTAEMSHLAKLPARFVANLGQWDPRVRFLTRVGAMTVFLEQAGWTYTGRELPLVE